MSHIAWSKIADDLLFDDWGQEYNSIKEAIKRSSDTKLIICLLLDIARSLRVLRCDNFKQIPTILRTIRANTYRKKARKKARRK